MASRTKPRNRADDLFPPTESWWPANIPLDTWRERTRGERPVYFTEQRDAETNAWWHQAQQRNQERTVPFDQVTYDEHHHYGEPWPEWIPIADTLEVALEAAPRFAQLPAAEFAAKGVALADVLAFDGGEHLTCDTGKLNKREVEDKQRAVRALGEALARLRGAYKYRFGGAASPVQTRHRQWSATQGDEFA